MTTGTPLKAIQHLCEGLTIQSITESENAIHLFLEDGKNIVGILAITASEDELHLEIVGGPPHRADRDEFSPYEQSPS